MVRYIFNIPRETHKYLVEPISKTSHLKIKLVKRFLKFSTSISSSDKPHLKYLMNLQENDRRSVFGRNTVNICEESKVSSVSEVNIQEISYNKIPEEEQYRIPLIEELLEIRRNESLAINLSVEQISGMINTLCIN